MDRAWRLAYSFVRDRSEAFDVVQQALLVAARKPDRIPDGDPWPWFSVVVSLEARNVRKKKRALTNQMSIESDRVRDPDGQAPEAAVMASESAALLWNAVDALPEAERSAVVLTHVNEMTHASAATALGVPRKTLTSRVQRGLDRLRQRLGPEGDVSLAHSLVVLPVAMPAGGWAGAVEQWKSGMIANLSIGASTATTVGSVIVMKKLGLAAATVALLFAGWWGNETYQAVREHTGQDDATVNATPDPRLPATNDPDAIAERARLQAQHAEAVAERDRLAADNERLSAALDELRARERETVNQAEADAHTGAPVFTFGELGSLEGVLNARWDELAKASLTVADSMKAVHEASREGRQASRSTRVALQKNVERMRVYEYGVLDKIPSAAQHNGELTHPISLTNLLAATLEQLGAPLTERQIEKIARLGERFEREFDALETGDSPAVLRSERMLEEYLLKGEFTDDLYAVLTPAQRNLVVDPATHRRAFLDLYCPSLMIIHTSPIIVGETTEQIDEKLRHLVTQRYGVPEEDQPDLARAVEQWLSACEELVATPVPHYSLKNYSYDESTRAGEATVALLKDILATVTLPEAGRARLTDDPVFFIPRRVQPAESVEATGG